MGPGEEASLNFWFQPDASFPAREFQASPRCRYHLAYQIWDNTLLHTCLISFLSSQALSSGLEIAAR